MCVWKNDLFSVVIALRYMLSDIWYKEVTKELKVLIDKYVKKLIEYRNKNYMRKCMPHT